MAGIVSGSVGGACINNFTFFYYQAFGKKEIESSEGCGFVKCFSYSFCSNRQYTAHTAKNTDKFADDKQKSWFLFFFFGCHFLLKSDFIL